MFALASVQLGSEQKKRSRAASVERCCYIDRTRTAIEGDTEVTVPLSWLPYQNTALPSFRFGVNENGTLDEAVIGIPYFCTGDDIVVQFPIIITLDEAPPQGTLYKTFPGLDVPSGAYFHVGPSEPFLAPGREEGGLYVQKIGREDWLLSLTRLVDGEGVELPAKTHKDVIIWMYEFDDSDDLAGKAMHLEVSEAMQSPGSGTSPTTAVNLVTMIRCRPSMIRWASTLTAANGPLAPGAAATPRATRSCKRKS